MADSKQTVEIAFKVVGIDLKKIDQLAKAFTGIKTAVDATTKSINKFQQSLSKIKTPPSLARLATSLERLQNIKATNLNEISTSLTKLSKITAPKSLAATVTSLIKLSDVKVPNILNLAKGLELLVNTKFSGFNMKVTSIVTALKQFNAVSVPNILSLAKGLKLLMATPFSGFNLKITSVVLALERLKGITLPNVKAMSSGLKELVNLDIKALAKKILDLNVALSQLSKRGSLQSFATFAKDLRAIQGVLGKAGIAAKQAAGAFTAVGNAAQSSGLKLRTFGDKVRTVMEFRLISEGLLQLKAALIGGTQAIISYDQALKDLQAITGATDNEVAQMGATILDVASKTKFSAAEVAEGMRVIGQSGFSASESIQTMQAVSDLATGTLSSMATTVDLVTTAMRVFDIDASRSTEVVDVFANAVNKSKLTIDKLRTSMNFVGPIAKEAGVTFQELSAAMGTLANSGIRASTIGTGLRRVFAELVDPSKKLAAAADAVGVSLRDLSPESNDLSSVLANLRLVIKDTGTAFDIFGKRGAASVLALTSSSSQFDNMLNLVSRSGTAAKQAAKQMEGLGISFKNLKDKLGVLAIALGKGGIAQALKIVADTARFVVDSFILLAGTPMGGLVVSIGVLITAMAALSAAFVGLEIVAGTAVFVALQAAFASLTATVITATATFNGFLVSLGPVGAALALIGVIMYTVNSSMQQTSGELLTMASEFENLSKQVTDYYVSIVGLSEGSKELETKTLALRDQLLKVANGYGEAAEAAAKAAASISPLEKAITDNGKALKEYNDLLQQLQFDKLSKAAELANQSFTGSISEYSSGIRILKESFQEVVILFDRGFGKADVFHKQAAAASELVKKLRDNKAGFKELDEHVRSLDRTSKFLSSTNKTLIAEYDNLIETTDNVFENLRKTGQVDVMSTVEGFTELAKRLKYSGPILDALTAKFVKFKQINEGQITNIIEKWAKDLDTNSIVDFIDANQELIGVFKEGQEEQIRESAIKRAELVKNLVAAKELYAEELKTAKGTERIDATKKFLATERALVNQASKLDADSAKNTADQRIRALKFELEQRKLLLERANQNLVGQELLLERRREEIVRASEKRIADIRSGAGGVSNEEQLANYKTGLQKREAVLFKYYADIAALEAKGELTSEEANNRKLQGSVDFYAKSYTNALEYFEKVNKLENPEEYAKRQKIVLQAEEAYYKARAKFVNEYNKEIVSSNKKIKDAEDGLIAERDKNTKKIHENKKASIQKLLNLELSYTKKRESIERNLRKKIKDINDEIESNKRSAASDILSMESSTQEKIRQIKDRGKTDAQKDASNQAAANSMLTRGALLVAEADRTKDAEKLKRGVELLKQAEGIGQSLKNERVAINVLKSSLAGLKKARNVQAQIKELALLKKAEEEVAEAARKQAEAKQQYDTKVKNAKTAIAKITNLESDRHIEEMKNLNIELETYQKKVDLAREYLSMLADDPVAANKAKEQEKIDNDRHVAEINNIVDERKAIHEKFESAKKDAQGYANLTEEELGMSFDEFAASLNQFEKSVAEVSNEEIKVNMDNTEVEDTTTMLEEIQDTILDVLAEVFGLQDVTDLYDAIAKLKDKVVKVTTEFVTKGEPAKEFARGGRLPGFGGGDRRPVLAEDGEWWINKFAVRKYGDSFMSMINNMTLPKFTKGGPVGQIMPTAKGSNNSQLANFGKVDINSGGVKFPAIVHRSVMSELNQHLKRASLMGVN